MDYRHREGAEGAAVQGPGLLWLLKGMSPVHGPLVQGVQVHAQGNLAGAGRVQGGDAATAGPGIDCLAHGPKQPVGGRARGCHVKGATGTSDGPSQGARGAIVQQPASGLSSNAARWVESMVLGHRGAGFPTPHRCVCTIVGRTQRSQSALQTWRPCTSVS